MEQQLCRQLDNQRSTLLPHSRQLPLGWLGCDSRYRSIVSQLDLMIEMTRDHSFQNLPAELVRLLDTMRDHIDTEDRFMEMVDFPQAIQHSQRHQNICFHTAVLRYRLDRSGSVVAADLAHIRSLWLEHIQVQDRAFEEFLVPENRFLNARKPAAPNWSRPPF